MRTIAVEEQILESYFFNVSSSNDENDVVLLTKLTCFHSHWLHLWPIGYFPALSLADCCTKVSYWSKFYPMRTEACLLTGHIHSFPVNWFTELQEVGHLQLCSLTQGKWHYFMLFNFLFLWVNVNYLIFPVRNTVKTSLILG